MTGAPSPVEYLERVVQPALFEKLDAAFPEFGWTPKDGGWVATNRAFTKRRLGVRPDRVICKRASGFLIHGGEPVFWTTFINDDVRAQGARFVECVQELALRAGVPPLDAARNPAPPDREGALDHALRAAKRRLEIPIRPEMHWALAYLEDRGFSQADACVAGLGFSRGDDLADLPPTEGEADATYERAWDQRIVAPWRDSSGRCTALVGRSIDDCMPKYLCTPGPRPPLFGLPWCGAPTAILVEGIFDALTLRRLGIPNVLALGGALPSRKVWALLSTLGVTEVTLWLDFTAESPSGFQSTSALCKNLLEVPGPGPRIFLIDPREVWERAGSPRADDNVPLKVDPDSFSRGFKNGGEILEVLQTRIPLSLFLALHADAPVECIIPAVAQALVVHEGPLPSVPSELSADPLIRRALATSERRTEAGTALDVLLDSVFALRKGGAPPQTLHAELLRLLHSADGPKQPSPSDGRRP